MSIDPMVEELLIESAKNITAKTCLSLAYDKSEYEREAVSRKRVVELAQELTNRLTPTQAAASGGIDVEELAKAIERGKNTSCWHLCSESRKNQFREEAQAAIDYLKPRLSAPNETTMTVTQAKQAWWDFDGESDESWAALVGYTIIPDPHPIPADPVMESSIVEPSYGASLVSRWELASHGYTTASMFLNREAMTRYRKECLEIVAEIDALKAVAKTQSSGV